MERVLFSPRASSTGHEVRLACRSGTFAACTAGLARSFVQANLIVLPSRYAEDFRLLCKRNPVPCPLLAESKAIGVYNAVSSRIPHVSDDCILRDVDIRKDFPKYNVYQDGVLAQANVDDITNWWNERDHTAFLIGCSYSFEHALAAGGLEPAHVTFGRNVPMYRTTVPLMPSGVFSNATCVVSMRLYRREHVARVEEITRSYIATHGAPIAWGWDGATRIGLKDISRPEWGDVPVTPAGKTLDEMVDYTRSDFVPVFWGCGVTPQEAVICARLPGTTMAHAPGHMLLLDLQDSDIVSAAAHL